MIRAIAIIGAAALAVGVIIYSFFDCLRSDPRDIRGIKRGSWIAVILLLPVIGGILWLALGRPRYAPASSQPARGKGPDDDPTFLRQIDEKRRAEQADAELEEWERQHKSDNPASPEDVIPDPQEEPEPGAQQDSDPSAETRETPEASGSADPKNSAGQTGSGSSSTTPRASQDQPEDLPGDDHPDDPQGRPGTA